MCLPAAGNPASLVAAFLVHSSSFFPVLFHRSVICVRSDEADALFFSFFVFACDSLDFHPNVAVAIDWV